MSLDDNFKNPRQSKPIIMKSNKQNQKGSIMDDDMLGRSPINPL